MSIQSVLNSFEIVRHEMDKVVSGIETGHKAVEAAREFNGELNQYNYSTSQARSVGDLSNPIGGSDSLLPVARVSLEYLSNASLENNRQLLQELSKTTRIFFEHVIYQCARSNYTIGFLTRSDFIYNKMSISEGLETVLTNVAAEEVVTDFEIRSCKAMLSNLPSLQKCIKDAISKNGGDFVTAVGSTACSFGIAGGYVPYVNPTPIVLVLCKFVYDLYKKWPEHWYAKVHAFKLLGLEKELLEEENSLQRVCGQSSVESVLIESARDPNIAFYICQLFNDVIMNPQTSCEKKKKFFKEGKVNILTFARTRERHWTITEKTAGAVKTLSDKFWRVSYFAFCCFEEYIDQYERSGGESNKFIKDHEFQNVVLARVKSSGKKIISQKADEVLKKLLNLDPGQVVAVTGKRLQNLEEKIIRILAESPQLEPAELREKISQLQEYIEDGCPAAHSADGAETSKGECIEELNRLQEAYDKALLAEEERIEEKEQINFYKQIIAYQKNLEEPKERSAAIEQIFSYGVENG